MPTAPESDSTGRQSPWWAGSRPLWRSPWSLDEEEPGESPASQPEPAEKQAAVTRADNGGAPALRERVILPKPRPNPPAWQQVAGDEDEGAINPVAERMKKVLVAKSRPPAVGGSLEAGAPAESAPRQASATTPMKREGTTWASLILMAMAVLGLTFVAWLYTADSPPVEDKDIRIGTPRDAAPHITAPGRLEVFLGSIKPPPQELERLQAWKWDNASMINWLAANSQALDNLKDLLEDADWHGRHDAWHLTDLGSHPNWAAAAKLKQVEAVYLNAQQKPEAALSAALDLAELARRLQDILAWPSFYFRSLETHERCALTLAELLPGMQADDETMASFQRQFEACAPRDAHLREDVLPGFYLFEKKLLLGHLSGEPAGAMPGGDRRPVSKRLFFKTNETLGLMAVTFRQLIRQVGQATTEAEAMRAVWREPRGAREAAAYQPNGRGVTYARERLDPYLDVPAVHQLAKTRHALVELLFAVRRFVITERGLPASLKALHPRYITQLPLDPYSGELFRYDPAQGLLYSVGRDALPAGGRGDLPPLTDLNEPTVKIGSRMAVEGR